MLREGFWTGSTGFGWEKIQRKHKITNLKLVERIIQNPNGGDLRKGTERRIYRAFALRHSCGLNGSCEEVERIKLSRLSSSSAVLTLTGRSG